MNNDNNTLKINFSSDPKQIEAWDKIKAKRDKLSEDNSLTVDQVVSFAMDEIYGCYLLSWPYSTNKERAKLVVEMVEMYYKMRAQG